MASPKGLHVLFEYDEELDRQPVVPALVYDTSALVRDQLFIGLGNLLCHWPAYARYQYGDRILPIILAGTFDELPSVQETCKTSLFKVASSCTQDLLDAGIITTIPEDNQEKEKTGKECLYSRSN
ncbi:hypothetical protein BDB01DRAFT_726215 [Pilobolus umbonatus]|nr:hypothetical protein BDB01DRAFT_726215 [Pilobolus umbonatus]